MDITFFGEVKRGVDSSELFDEYGSLKQEVYDHIEKNMWHYKQNSFAVIAYHLSNVMSNVGTYMRVKVSIN